MKRRQEEEERQRAEEIAAQQAALASLHSPQDGSRHDQYLYLIQFPVFNSFIILKIVSTERMENHLRNRYPPAPIRILLLKVPKVSFINLRS